MTIKAKYSGVCRVCGGSIRVGDRIEWERGRKAAHASCAAGEENAARVTGGGKPARTAGVCKEGDGVWRTDVYRLNVLDASSLIGQVRTLDGQDVVVLGAHVWHQSDGDNEDFGDQLGGGWGATLWVRAATPEEAAPLVAKRAAKEADKARRARLREISDRVLREGTVGAWQPGAPQGAIPEPEGKINWARLPQLVADGDNVHLLDSFDGRRVHRVLTDAALAEEVRRLQSAAE